MPAPCWTWYGAWWKLVGRSKNGINAYIHRNTTTLSPRFDAISKFFWAWGSRGGRSSGVTGPLGSRSPNIAKYRGQPGARVDAARSRGLPGALYCEKSNPSGLYSTNIARSDRALLHSYGIRSTHRCLYRLFFAKELSANSSSLLLRCMKLQNKVPGFAANWQLTLPLNLYPQHFLVNV